MLSDVSVTSDRATFRVPELYRGIADTNYAHILARQIGTARARDLMMTGRTLTAEEAVAFGLVAQRRSPRRPPGRRRRDPRRMLSHRTSGSAGGEAHMGRLLRPV